jgi:ribose transport system permease protein
MRFGKRLLPLLLAVVILQVLFRFGLPFVWGGFPGFWSFENQLDIAQRISVNSILALGMTLTILIGGIDLSVGAVVALVGTTTVYLLGLGAPQAQSLWQLAMAVAAGLGVAGLFGTFHGVCAATTRMPPFIITLATMWIARGAALRFNEGRPMPIPDHQTAFLLLGNGRMRDLLPGFLYEPLKASNDAGSKIGMFLYQNVAGIPIPVLVMTAIFIVAAVLLHRTRFGQHLYAIGGNREAARYTGIPLVRREVAVYVICSLLAGVAGMIHTSQLYSAQPASGQGFELDAIAAAVVGGTSFSGGVGTMGGTLIGAIIIGILDKGLNQAGVHYSFQYMVKGLVILVAVYIDVRRQGKK